MVQLIKSAAELAQILSTKPQVLLKFSATWCGPCRQVAPLIEKLAPEYPRVAIYEVDIDQNQDIAAEYEVSAVPSFVFLRAGKEVKRVRGANMQEVVAGLREQSA